MDEFDKLFNDNFGDGDEDLNKGLNKIMDLMSKLNKGVRLAGLNPDETSLGEPTSTREFERDGVLFEETTWETPEGTIVRIATKEDIEFSSDFFNKNNIPFGKTYDRKEVPLEVQLEIAKKAEKYEECARLRDLIDDKNDNVKKERDILNKMIDDDKAYETLDNKGFPDEDEWNF